MSIYISRDKIEHLKKELDSRYGFLNRLLETSDIESNREGLVGRSRWKDVTKIVETEGSKVEISLAIADFNAILTEIKRLK